MGPPLILIREKSETWERVNSRVLKRLLPLENLRRRASTKDWPRHPPLRIYTSRDLRHRAARNTRKGSRRNTRNRCHRAWSPEGQEGVTQLWIMNYQRDDRRWARRDSKNWKWEAR